ncbi:MAG: response regulator transcription factor, partial [Chromatiales bacterium]|nr:response regulator transcription factor [Chromatiales bacterium]
MRLLLVEDDTELSERLRASLTREGYAVDLVDNGEDGCFAGETEAYDCIILDLGLPRMNGLDVLKQWRKQRRTMPVLILTARDQWSEKVAGFDAGADDYVAKPFHMEEVLARVRALVRRAAGHATAEITCGTVRLDTRASR